MHVVSDEFHTFNLLVWSSDRIHVGGTILCTYKAVVGSLIYMILVCLVVIQKKLCENFSMLEPHLHNIGLPRDFKIRLTT